MISSDDFYKVMCAMVPLYFAMLVAYVSVKWCNIFSPDQCSGINRFVAAFAVPVLSFHFISQNNPYQMDTKFILADTLSKAFVLSLLSIWCIVRGELEWLITIFSVSTLPNTLVMGIPLLRAMYGEFTQSLMVQLVVLQCIIWYTLLLFLFEYRAATILIQTRFPGQTAAAITKFHIDNDVISLDGRDPLCTDSEIDDNGRIHVRIRRSTSSAPPSSSMGLTPRPSNLSNAEIFSINTPNEFGFGHRPVSPRLSGYASSDAYSLQPTPRASNFNELDLTAVSPTTGKVFRQPSPVVKMVWESPVEGQGFRDDVGGTYVCKIVALFSCLHFVLHGSIPTKPRMIACGTKMATISMGIRFVAGPIVMSAASVAVGLRGVHLHAAIVQAALPQGIVPFVFAREYGLHPDILSTGVIFGMLVSLPVTLLYYILLGL
ncbi:hypothetical protein DH2020_035189 [Rehmannia glutinosa]|uniref:Auxin efflux carrier component n=1 Tax=Rehmannia glutinosa TaxID=99300 RepID=A0ABR0V9T8_REHGL